MLLQTPGILDIISFKDFSVFGLMLGIIIALLWFINRLLNEAKDVVKTHKEELLAKDLQISKKHEYIMELLKESMSSFVGVENALKSIKENNTLNVTSLSKEHEALKEKIIEVRQYLKE